MQIKLKRLVIQNFKGCTERTVEFSHRTLIAGMNSTGKTTILDAFIWLLFGKDSAGNTSFKIRPEDEQGNRIDNVEIMVEGTLDVNGKEVTLKKVQKQIWRKKPNSDITELQGNENLFEINGYPKPEKDYKGYISELVEEKIFRLITNPKVFIVLPWKEQREILMRLVDDLSDVDIAESDNRFTALIPELEQASPDDIRKKYTKALNIWKKKQVEIPARIDEVSKQIADVDVAELELKANAIREQIADAECQQENSELALKEYDRVSSELFQVKGEMRVISDKACELLEEKRRNIQKRKDETQRGFDESRQMIRMCELDIERLQASIERKEAEKIRLQGDWKAEKAKVFPEYEGFPKFDGDICPTCRQALPDDMKQENLAAYEERKRQHLADYEASKEAFESGKKNRMNQINEEGKLVVAGIKKAYEELERTKAGLEQAKKDSMKFNKEESIAMEELRKLPNQPDLSDNQEYEALQLRYSRLEENLRSMDNGADYRSQIKEKISGLRKELSEVEKEIAAADNSKIEERIEALQAEQREVSQKVADQEKMLCMLDAFIQAKMEKVAWDINKHFKYVAFRLFKEQINGGIVPTCEIKHVEQSRGDINEGHKILAGLDIISTLSELYSVSAPVFVDGAESINDFRIPDMDCQMVLLKVSDDTELKVRV